MYLKGATFDKSRLLPLYARVNESSSPMVFTFLNEDGSAHDISGYNFELIIRQTDSSVTNVFKLSIGSGLTVQGADDNELLIEISASQATLRPREYFYRLYSVTDDNTWLNGPFIFHSGKFDGVEETATITITESGTHVTITISAGGGEVAAGTLVLSGSFDSTGDVYPSGTISKGEIFISNGAGTSGTKFGQNGAWFVAIVDNPGQTGSNWYVLYPDIL